MWFIFLAPFVAWSAIGSLYAVTHGSTIAITALAADQWQRRKGFRKGEGQFTEREGNKYYGVLLADLQNSQEPAHDLSLRLSQLAGFLPEQFKPFISKKYDMTKSEGATLRAAMVPALGALRQYLESVELFQQTSANPQSIEDIEAAAELVDSSLETLKSTAYPVELFFKQFPQERVKLE